MTGRGKSGRGGGGRGRGASKRSLDNAKDLVDEEEQLPVKKSNRGGGAGNKGKQGGGRKQKEEPPPLQLDDDEDELGEEEEDDLDDDDSDSEDSNPDQPVREYGPRSFVVLKTDFDKLPDPPIWRIDGSSLLQKYTPFKDTDGTMLYKSTSVYSGWSINNKESYYPAVVTFKRQEKNDTVIHFDRSQIEDKNK